MWARSRAYEIIFRQREEFLYIDGLNWPRTLTTILLMSSFADFPGDITCFEDKPMTVADSNVTVRLIVLEIWLDSL